MKTSGEESFGQRRTHARSPAELADQIELGDERAQPVVDSIR